MKADPEALLRRATSRAKSDVANKLVSMFLHELSRQLNQTIGTTVNGSFYAEYAASYFAGRCPYCARELLARNVAVEHLEGMNRLRGGLHVPGNVVVSCADCNREKRRDDQRQVLELADSGWESFLAHDSTRCEAACKTCEYWRRVHPDPDERSARLSSARNRILAFRSSAPILPSVSAAQRVQPGVREVLEELYRQGQDFAESSMRRALAKVSPPKEG